MDRFVEALKPLLRKLRFVKFVNFLLYCLGMAGLLCGGLILASRLAYVPELTKMILAVLILCGLFGLTLYIVFRPGVNEAALTGDKLGNKEVFITAYEILKKDSKPTGLKALTVKDAIGRAEKKGVHRSYKMKFSMRAGIFAAALAVFFLGAAYLPLPAALSNQVAARKDLAEKLASEVEKIEAAKKENIDELTPAQVREIDKAVKELKENLEKSKTDGEAVKAFQKAQEDLLQAYNAARPPELTQIGEKLAGHSLTRELGQALLDGDMSKIQQNYEAFEAFLQTASDEELEQLAELYNQMAEEVANDPELAQALRDLSQKLEEKGYEDILNAMDNAMNPLMEKASQNAGLRQSIENLNNALASSAANMERGQNGQNAMNAQNNQAGQTGQNSQTGQQGQAQGQGQSSQGQGQDGQGQGQSGQGQGAQNGQNGQSGSQRGTGHIEDENIYSREAEAYSDYEGNIDGGQDGEESGRAILPGAEKGEIRPYREALPEYKDEALKALDDYSIPAGMRDIIKRYFSDIE